MRKWAASVAGALALLAMIVAGLAVNFAPPIQAQSVQAQSVQAQSVQAQSVQVQYLSVQSKTAQSNTSPSNSAQNNRAQQVQFGDENIGVALFADGAPQPGQQWMLALHFTPKSDAWHGYWSNPGEAGLGMALQWQLPPGWEVGEPLYPMPKTLRIGGLMNHVYEGEYTVLVPIQVPTYSNANANADVDANANANANVSADDGVGDAGDVLAKVARGQGVSLRANYLACTDRICVPQDAALSIDPAALVSDPRFAEWRAAIVPQLDQAAEFEIKGNHLRISIPVPASLPIADPYIFLKTSDLGGGLEQLYAAPQTFARSGDRLIAQITLEQLQLPADSPLMKTRNPLLIEGILAFSEAGVRFAAQTGDVPAVETGERLAGSAQSGGSLPSLWSLILAAFLGGLLLNILPCVFPILSLKALTLARAGGDEAQAKREGLAYSAGAVLACTALGAMMLALRAAGEAVGWAFQLQEPRVVALLFLLAGALTANFLGLFEIPGLSFSSRGRSASAGAASGAASGAEGGGRAGSAFVTGLLAAFVATPCTGPFMAAALGAALILPTGQALVLFASLGLGLALPFLLLGFVPALRNRLPKPGPWMERFRRWMALPMGLTLLALAWLLWRLGGWGYLAMVAAPAFALILLLAAYGHRQKTPEKAGQQNTSLNARPSLGRFQYLTLALIFISLALVPRPNPQAATIAPSLLEPQTYSAEALAQARASGKPVFLWFTASWCVTCKVNERVAIEREDTRRAFEQAGIISLRGDWSRPDAEITAMLGEHGAAGVPLYLWYPPGTPEGAGQGQKLPQILPPDALIDLAEGLEP